MLVNTKRLYTAMSVRIVHNEAFPFETIKGFLSFILRSVSSFQLPAATPEDTFTWASFLHPYHYYVRNNENYVSFAEQKQAYPWPFFTFYYLYRTYTVFVYPRRQGFSLGMVRTAEFEKADKRFNTSSQETPDYQEIRKKKLRKIARAVVIPIQPEINTYRPEWWVEFKSIDMAVKYIKIILE